QELLNTHHEKVRVIELGGALSFATIDIVSRQISAKRPPQFMIFDFRRVAGITSAAGRLLTATLQSLHKQDVITILAGIEPTSHVWDALGNSLKKASHIRNFYLLDEAIEWAEDQIVYRYGGAVDFHQATHLDEQALLQGLTDAELDALIKIGITQTYQTGDRIISAGDDATSLFFLQSGMVSVKLRSGVRLATLTSGMVFGEMALLENRRTADVIADTAISCHVVTLAAFDQFRTENMRAGERIMRNLALLLVGRLIKANKKVDLLSAG
ncbi:MAG TPA: cyclic nucleotide-binding domain-containing protein, partial [Afipia sp.]